MILVTGSHGFIGKSLTFVIEAQTARPVARCDPNGHTATAEELIRIYAADIEAVFHMGAISDTTCEDVEALHETNVLLPLLLSDFCRRRRIPFIYASSASVYGNGEGPLNLYAASKKAFDTWDREPPPRDWYGCRFFNVYGPGEEHKGKQASLVHQLLEAQKKGEHMRLFRLETLRDFVHVDDVVDVMLWMWRERPPSGIYDVGTGEAVSISKLRRTICEVTERAVVTIDQDHVPKHLEGKYQFHTCADLRALRAAGYKGTFRSLPEGIRSMT